MGRDQRVELDEFLRLEEAARGPERGDDQQRVADVGVGEAMQLARILERDRDARAPAALREAHDAERLRRLEHHVADRHGPGRCRRRRRW